LQEACNSLAKLDTTTFPKYEDFYSHLQGENVLEEESAAYQTLLARGCDSLEALSYLKIKEPPPAGAEIYAKLVEHWRSHNLKTWRDILVQYLEADIVPFANSVGNFLQFYLDKKIDIFKTFSSLPSMAAWYLFNSIEPKDRARKFLYLPADTHDRIRASLQGGLVSISRRLVEVGDVIKPYKYKVFPSLTEKIVFLDFNSLYVSL